MVVLSSSESTALESWLDANNYNIPDGAAAYLKPYVQKGQYFFVAKVNMDKAATPASADFDLAKIISA